MGLLIALLISHCHFATQFFRLDDSVVTGAYYQGDGLGVNPHLTLGAKGVFSYRGYTDDGGDEPNSGSWKYDGDVLVLVPKVKNNPYNWTGTETRFLPISWGKAVYLVSENAVPGFLAVARKGKYSEEDETHPLHYRKLRGPRLSVIPRSDKPQFSPRFADFYANGHVKAKVLTVGPNGNISFSSPTPNRVQVDMLLTINDWVSVDVRVIKLSPKGGIGKVIYHDNSDRRIRVGDVLTTGGECMTPAERGRPVVPKPPIRRG